MILNFFLFPLFVFLFFSIGNFLCFIISKFYLKKKIFRNYFFFEKILYSLFFISFYVLVFNFVTYLNNLVIYLILLIILIMSLFYISKSDLISFKNNLFVIFAISLISVIMQPGYDAGLYHIPYQTWIKNYKILLGFSELNLRFSLGSIYNYTSVLFWNNNIFLFVTYLTSLFYLIFFLFIKEYLNSSNKKITYGILLIVTIPLWERYIYPSYSLVDAQFGIISLITLSLIFFNLRNWHNGKIDLKDIFLISILLSFIFTLKSSGILFLPLALYLFFLITFKIKDKKYLYLPYIIFLVFLAFWMLRGFIISGCFFYPIGVTCLPVDWFNYENLKYINNEISLYAYQPFKIINFNVLISENMIAILIFLIISIIITYLFIKYLLKYQNSKINNILFLLFVLIYTFVVFKIGDLRGFSRLVEANDIIFVKKIIINEILFFTIILTSAFFIILIKFKHLILKINLRTFLLIETRIFYFLLFLISIWILKAPQPRFGFGFIPLLLPMFYLIFFEIKNKKIDIKLQNSLKFALIVFALYIPVVNIDKDTKFIYDLKKINYQKIEKRNKFGSRPLFQNLCWNSKNCYIGEDKIIIKKNNFLKVLEN